MKNSKLIRVLSACSTAEIKEITQFLATPLFNSRTDVQQFYEFLQPFLLAKTPIPEKKKVYQQLFPKQKFSISRMDLLMSYLFRLVQQYLTWKTFSMDDFAQKIYATKAYQQRGLTKDFEQNIDKLEQQLTESPIRDAEHYQFLYQLQWEKFQAKDQSQPEQRQASEWQMTQTFDLAYLAAKLKHACLLKAHQLVYPLTLETSFLEEIINYVPQPKYLEKSSNQPLLSLLFNATDTRGCSTFSNLQKAIV